MTIYLDYQATTPLAPETRAAMLPWLDKFANPHSAHRLGREAAAAIEVARDQVAALLPRGGRVYFTSGATEALNWAIKNFGNHVALATEHAAVLDPLDALAHGPVAIVGVDTSGLADPTEIDSVTTRSVDLVSAMLVNNEIGVIQPIDAIAEHARQIGALVLCDAVQAYGRFPIPPGCDLIAISAHKIHGPKGVGALWVRDGIKLDPLLHGGGQEGGLRSGTLSPMLCAGFGAAAMLMAERRDADAKHVERLAALVLDRLKGWVLNGSREHRYMGNLNLRLPGLDAARLISDVREVAFSAGSACASGSGRPSHVLKALGLSDRDARASIRLGFGRYTTESELSRACALIDDAAARQQALAA